MFDAQKALRHLFGKRFAYKELRDELGKVRVKNLGNLPVEFGVHEIFDLLWRERWIREDADGLLALRIPESDAEGVFDLATALWPLNGRLFSPSKLRKTLAEMLVKNLRSVPAELGVRELRDFATKKGWLIECREGYIVVVP